MFQVSTCVRSSDRCVLPWILLGCLIFFLGTLPACSSSSKQVLDTPQIKMLNENASKQVFVLHQGDRISVNHLYRPDLNQDVGIRSDGKVSLPLIGDVQAAGLTIAELDSELSRAYTTALGASTEMYSLVKGETVAVKHLYNKDLDEEVKIRPDGKISLPMVGDVPATGLSPVQLGSELEKLYEKFLGDAPRPEITIVVTDFMSPEVNVILLEPLAERAYVGGEVAQCRMIPLQGEVRALDAVLLAGGLRDTAKLKNVILLRNNGSSQPDAYLLNLKKVIHGELPDVILKPYDIVFVPKSTIAKMNVYVYQYINSMIPTSVIFNFPYVLNPTNVIPIP